jgi:hypothetical protein
MLTPDEARANAINNFSGVIRDLTTLGLASFPRVPIADYRITSVCGLGHYAKLTAGPGFARHAGYIRHR